MPGLVNLVSGRTVLETPARAGRPFDVTDCPFCPGNEAELLGVISERAAATGPGWATRIVPNRFPIIQPNGSPIPGRHEVVIETPRHDADLETLSHAERTEVVLAWRDRYRALAARWHQVLVFRNRGRRAGQSLAHPHSQITALGGPTPAEAIRESLLVAHYRRTGRALVDDLAGGGGEPPPYPVTTDAVFAAFVPQAAEVPFEVWIAPRGGARDFGGLSDTGAAAFAGTLADVLRRMARLGARPDYTLMIVTAPRGARRAPHWRWFAAIRPRLSETGGFEQATGLSVNASIPGHCAALLREATDDTNQSGLDPSKGARVRPAQD